MTAVASSSTSATGPAPGRLRGIALAAIAANVLIVLTGGTVRVTGSGLGCPDWPTCEAGSVVPTGTAHSPVNQAIEFGNRVLSALVLGVVVALLLAARRHASRQIRGIAWALVGGVVAQAILGGITVRLELHPLIVAAHFLVSMVLIALAVTIHHRLTWRGSAVPGGQVVLARTVPIVAAVVLVLGTLVTASGPHAGDPGTPRLGLDIRTVAVAHADAVWLLLGLTVAVTLVARRTAPDLARAGRLLLVAALVQGAVGYTQYAVGIPAGLVVAHLLGACLVWITALRVGLTTWPQAGVAGASDVRAEPVASTTSR